MRQASPWQSRTRRAALTTFTLTRTGALIVATEFDTKKEELDKTQAELDAAAQKNEGKAASAALHPPAPPQLRFADFFELNCKWLEHLAGIPIGGSSPGPADCLLLGYARVAARLGTVATFAAGVVLTSMAMGVLYADLRLEPR